VITDEVLRKLTPLVRRLFGFAAGGPANRDTYRDHLFEKYGRPGESATTSRGCTADTLAGTNAIPATSSARKRR
jgi:hypothetical protein